MKGETNCPADLAERRRDRREGVCVLCFFNERLMLGQAAGGSVCATGDFMCLGV